MFKIGAGVRVTIRAKAITQYQMKEVYLQAVDKQG
jgi:hypothetical protein